ncbi:MAG: hypothetical protein HUJ57_08125 [Erysipelotrichaceae bacterium]|nr:hypothetical protein [Erysipelotrichaceae bacterium]
MKSKWAKIISLVLVGMLLLSGCSSKPATDEPTGGNEGGTTETTGGVPQVDSVKGDKNLQTYPLSEEKITLEYWYPMAGSIGTLGDFNESEFFQWYEEKTNVHINFTVPAAGSESEAFNMLFMTDQLPDIMYTTGSYKYRDGMDASIDDGYIADMAKYLEWAPNYCSWINNVEGAEKDVFTDTGKMYGFWGFWKNMENGYADQGLSIRKDFLDKVGMEVPTTYDEWTEVMTAFKEQLGIEAPFYTSKYGIDYGEFMAGFGVAPYWYQVDGKIMYGPMQDGYKEYLTFMHDWYEKGLLDPDFDTRQSTGVAADNDMILNDKIGALIDWGTRMTDAYISRGATNPEFYATAAPQPKKSASDPDPAYRVAANNFHSMSGITILISATSEHMEEAIRWVDGFYAEDVYWNANYGIESEEGTVWYKADDGHRIGDYDFRYSNPDGLDSATVAAKYWAKNPPVRVEAAQIEQMPEDRAASYGVWSTYEPKNYIPVTTTMTLDEGTEYAQMYTEIELYVQEMNVKFIKGDKSLDEYDAYREELKKLGIERCTEIQQATLDRYNNR